jgi:hypothetical protein
MKIKKSQAVVVRILIAPNGILLQRRLPNESSVSIHTTSKLPFIKKLQRH